MIELRKIEIEKTDLQGVMSCLDMQHMQQDFKAAQGEPDAKTAALVDTGLMRGLSVGMFLRRFET